MREPASTRGAAGPGRDTRPNAWVRRLTAGALAVFAGGAAAADLLVGTIPGGNGAEIGFRLEAEDRKAVGGRDESTSGRPATRSPGSAGSD